MLTLPSMKAVPRIVARRLRSAHHGTLLHTHTHTHTQPRPPSRVYPQRASEGRVAPHTCLPEKTRPCHRRVLKSKGTKKRFRALSVIRAARRGTSTNRQVRYDFLLVFSSNRRSSYKPWKSADRSSQQQQEQRHELSYEPLSLEATRRIKIPTVTR